MSLPANSVSTADIVAAARGMHLRDPQPIFKDPYAHLLCGWFFGLVLRFRPLEYVVYKFVLKPVAPITMCVVMRARYAEQALERAVQQGIRRYVIIGAGMDSFAFRRLDLLEQIESFEIDHPVTQRKKLRRVRRAGLTIPPHHHFIKADLTRVSPVDALSGSSFDMGQPSFMSLLGVAYYLTQETLAATARSLATDLPAGTYLVLDYLLDEASCDAAALLLRTRMLDFVTKRGEPMRAEYSLDEMNALMVDAGFEVVENFAIIDLEDSYREEFGTLQFDIPGIFAFGLFRVVARTS